MRKILLLIIWMLTLISTLSAQEGLDENEVFIIQTVDGSEFIGTIVFEDQEILRLDNKILGLINIPQNTITWVRKLNKKDFYQRYIDIEPRQNATHSMYFTGPTAYSLKEKGVYYQNFLLIYNELTFAIDSRFSIGVNTIPAFFWQGNTPIWMNLKYTFPIQKDQLNLAIGTYSGIISDVRNPYFFVLPYGALTFGGKNRNWTIGVGYESLGQSDKFDFQPTPVLIFSGKYKLRGSTYIITENYFGNRAAYTQIISSLGVRWTGRRISFDLGGVLVTFRDGGVFPVPLVGLNIPLGASAKLE